MDCADIQFDAGSHTYTLDDKVVPSVTQVINFTKGPKPIYPAGSAEKGTRIHRVLELDDKAQLSLAYVKLIADRPMYQVLSQWRQWREKYPGKMVGNEQLYCGMLDGMLFAGTIDRIWRIKAGDIVLDIKSGRMVPKQHAMQVWAYAHLHTANTDEEVVHRGCAYVSESGVNVRYYDDSASMVLFKEKLVAYYEEMGNE